MLKSLNYKLWTTHFGTALLVYLQFVFPHIRTLELSTLANFIIVWSKYHNYIQIPKWSPLFDINNFYLYTLTYAAIYLTCNFQQNHLITNAIFVWRIWSRISMIRQSKIFINEMGQFSALYLIPPLLKTEAADSQAFEIRVCCRQRLN